MDDKEIIEIIEKVKPFTMCSIARLAANIKSVEYICKNNIEGDIVEIGVWQGGSILSMILALEKLNEVRNIHLYDTFEGMSVSSIFDVDIWGDKADTIMPIINWCKSPLCEVQNNINFNISKLHDKINYHVGDICKTKFIPQKIAILRLDTDFYESTKFELENFYNMVSTNGVIIIDDYGHWQGCKKAVDEYFKVITPVPVVEDYGTWQGCQKTTDAYLNNNIKITHIDETAIIIYKE